MTRAKGIRAMLGAGILDKECTQRGQTYYKKLKRIVLAQLIVQITKQSLYKANFFGCSLANRDKPVAATLQRKCSGGNPSAIITTIITKESLPNNYFLIISARMVKCKREFVVLRWMLSWDLATNRPFTQPSLAASSPSCVLSVSR